MMMMMMMMLMTMTMMMMMMIVFVRSSNPAGALLGCAKKQTEPLAPSVQLGPFARRGPGGVARRGRPNGQRKQPATRARSPAGLGRSLQRSGAAALVCSISTPPPSREPRGDELSRAHVLLSGRSAAGRRWRSSCSQSGSMLNLSAAARR